MVRQIQHLSVEHLPSGMTHVYVAIGVDRVYAFSLLTRDYWKLSERDVRDAVDSALELNRPPLKVRRAP